LNRQNGSAVEKASGRHRPFKKNLGDICTISDQRPARGRMQEPRLPAKERMGVRSKGLIIKRMNAN